MLLSVLKLKIFHRLFRLRNRHNLVCVVNMCDMNRVQVGRKSYGAINVVDFSPADTKLIIGNYCSIAGGTTFLLGGEHNLDTISTYPFKVRLFGEEREAGSKGNIVIKDDVWIGQNAKLIKYRLDESLRKKLEKIDVAALFDKFTKEDMPAVYTKLDEKMLDEFLKR